MTTAKEFLESILESISWPEEEALTAAEEINDMIDSGDYTKEEIKQKVSKDFKYWLKVFGDDAQGKKDMEIFKDTLMGKLRKAEKVISEREASTL